MILAPEGFQYSGPYETGIHVPSRIGHTIQWKSLNVWEIENTYTGTGALRYSANEGHAALCSIDLAEF